MNTDSAQRGALYNIAAVERDTGLSKDILRVWERRYGFPKPERDHNDDRLYTLPDFDGSIDLSTLGNLAAIFRGNLRPWPLLVTWSTPITYWQSIYFIWFYQIFNYQLHFGISI